MCTRRASASADLLHEYDGPTAFAIPGNHDWIDGLETYTRHIQHKGWLGGWLLPQVCLTQQSKTKRNEKKRNETKRNETKRNETEEEKRKEKTTTLSVNFMRSPVLDRAAQGSQSSYYPHRRLDKPNANVAFMYCCVACCCV